MHDRRIDGQAHTFGNAGGLFMNAMTWYDHETESIWSQPWGRALEGPLAGVELFLVPSQVTTWANWRAEQPETLAMTNDVSRFGFRQGFDPDFVIGLTLADQARAYYYRDVAERQVVNDQIGEFPVLLWAEDGRYHAYLRRVGDQVLTFRWWEGDLLDEESGSTWDVGRGLSVAGALMGESLQEVPSSTAYDWAWIDFYPHSTFYMP